MSPERRTLLALFSLAFGLRVLYAVLVGTAPEINPDPTTFDFTTAVRIAAGETSLAQPFTPAAPGYPLLLAIVFLVGNSTIWTAIVLQALLGAVTVLIVYQLGSRLFDRPVGLLSALWLCIYVHHVHYASVLIRDTTTTLLFVLLCYLLAKRFEQMRTAIWTGLVFTLLIHVEPLFLIFLPFILLFLVLRATGHGFLNLQYSFLVAATVLALSIPWTVRNYMVYHEFVPISLEGSRYTRPVLKIITTGSPWDEPAVEAGAARERSGFLANTGEFWRVVRLRGDGEPAWSLRHNVISIVNYGLMIPFVLAALVFGFRRRRRAVAVLAGSAFLYYLIRAFYGADERSRLIIEPLLIVLAFYGLTEVVRRLRGTGEADAPAD